MPGRELTLHFVRHGETAGNAEHRFQMPDVPLSENGRAQADVVASTLLQTTSADAILSSDYLRTMETASIIGKRLGLAVQEEPALRERNFGIARGLLYADIGEEVMSLWREPHYRIEQGESWADVHARVGRFIDGLRQSSKPRELILVTHGGAMSVALAYLADKSIDEFKVEAIENCGVRSVVVSLTLSEP